MPEITPVIAAFLLYIKQGESPRNAVDMACIDVFPACMETNERLIISLAKEQIFSFLHPEIPERIRLGAKLLKFSNLNFDASTMESSKKSLNT